jgi:hypothetical protein
MTLAMMNAQQSRDGRIFNNGVEAVAAEIRAGQRKARASNKADTAVDGLAGMTTKPEIDHV